ncbi:MAG: extracellular solute-binding protein [Deltaproteobacteria bacterium]|nr:extracellular solute-binding protein [Deltaproteobacteria bacterium]
MQQLSWDFGNDKIITSLISGNAPDVFEIGSTWGPHFSQSGVLKEITQETRLYRSRYLMWEPVMVQDKVYGFPWLVGTRFLFYNKTLFKKAGLDPARPPRTWNELLRAAQKIKGLSSDTYGYGIAVAEEFAPWHTFIPYLWNGGGDVLSRNWKEVVLNSSAARQTLSFYQSLKPYALLNRQEQIDQMFAAEKVGMILSGAWNFKSIQKTNSKLEYGVSSVPTPKSSQSPMSFGGGEMLVILNKTKHPKEAFEFIRFLTSYEVELSLSRTQRNVLPSLKTALKDPFFEQDSHMKGFAEQMLTAKTPPAHVGWMKMEKILSSLIDRVMLQDEPIGQALEITSDRLSKILNQTQKRGAISDERLTFWILAFLLILVGSLWFLRNRNVPAGEMSTWVLVLPWVGLFLVFSLYPLLYSLVISFSDYHVLTSRFSLSGFSNYFSTLKDPEFLKALGHTLFFALGTVPFTLVISIGLAALIHQGVPWKSLFQAGFFLPVVTSIIVVATLFTFFYSENGFLNFILTAWGIPKPNPAWLINHKWALLSIMAMAVWSSSGYYLILFLAALQSIPSSLYEASRLDGASSIQQFFKITLPQLKPMILFVMVINTINSLQVFPEIFTMTKGGPARSTTTIVYYLYEKGFSEFQMGTASAVAYILALLMCVFAYFQMKVLREEA